MERFVLPPQATEPLRILLVEDSRADADLLLEMLDDELPDAVVAVTGSMADAVPLLAGPLDIVITDLSLPDADGLEALKGILTARPDIAVVVMTGRQDRQLALEALSAGAEDYLVKGSHDARAVATSVLYAAQRRSAEQQARRYERLSLGLLDAMEAATCAVDGSSTIVAVNRAWRQFAAANGADPATTGIGASYVQTCSNAVGDDSAGASEVAIGLRELLAGRLPRFEHDYPCHSPSEERWFSVRINPLPDTGAVLSHVDITGAKQVEHALSHLSLHDALTDLPNRNLLGDRLTQALSWTARSGGGVAVAFLDVDEFKRINDSLGHHAGDELLQEIAWRLGRSLRDQDTLARYSGDEFVVVWPGVEGEGQAQQLAARLAACFEDPFVLEAATVAVTASLGLVVGHAPSTADELLLAADAAMYDAKSRGRGRIRLYTDELRRGADTRLRTEAELQLGLDRGEFVLHYQPVIDLRAGAVVGVEALVRWQHPDGLRMPDSFIGVAEATGLVVPLGGWVLDAACKQGAAWVADGLALRMAVNFSTRQIGHPDVISAIEQALEDSGLPAWLLLAEVTESTVMEDAERAQVALTRIAELGVGVAIDDFGTGYSSLLYLKRYPISALKIDRSFVAGIGVNDDDDAIVASVISLAHAVGAVCIAEGVETAAQHTALRALGCDFAQGYLFGRPVEAEELPGALRTIDALLALSPGPRTTREVPVLPRVPAHVLDRIGELHRDGGSLHTIAAALNHEKVVSPSGRRWHATSVAKIIAVLAASPAVLTELVDQS